MINIDINRLSHLYYTEKKSALEIAKIFDCDLTLIYRRMKENGMQRRTYSEAHKVRYDRDGLHLDIAEIVRLYFEEHLTLSEIGARLGVCSDSVRQRLIAAGYERRKRGESRHPRKPRDSHSRFTDADLLEMERLYCEAEWSSAEIACRYNCCDVTVRERLKQRGVRLRTRKQAQILRRKKEVERKPVGETVPHKNPVVGETLVVAPDLAERVLQLRNEEHLTIDAIAERCSLSNLEVYTILQEAGGL